MVVAKQLVLILFLRVLRSRSAKRSASDFGNKKSKELEKALGTEVKVTLGLVRSWSEESKYNIFYLYFL